MNQGPVPAMGFGIYYLTVYADASASYDPDGTIVSYVWDWGDGTTVTNGPKVSHAYEIPCTGRQKGYVVTLTVVDDLGATASKSTAVRPTQPPGRLPYAVFSHSENGLTVSVDASMSYDADGVIVKYGWHWGDGSEDTDGVTAHHTYSTAGSYVVRLVVIDNASLTSWVDQELVVAPAPLEPVACFYAMSSYLDLMVDASSSYDPDGQIMSYVWDWEDGTELGSGMIATHTYATDHEGRRPGFYLVGLTVTDDSGSSAWYDVIVPVSEPPVPPIASFSVVVTDLHVAVNGNGSHDPDGTIALYSWDFGDGATATGVSSSHSYEAPGTYTVSLIVTDNAGLSAASNELVTVTSSIPPQASFSLSIFGLTASTNARSSSDDGEIVSWMWDWGDGGASSGAVGSHAYASAGVYQIRLTVVDDSGLNGTAVQNAIVNLIPPVASFTMDSLYLAVEVYGTYSFDLDGSIASWQWNWGDGSSPSSGVHSEHVYASAGNYTVTLTVTDSSGVTGTATRNCSATIAPPPTGTFLSSVHLDGTAVGPTQRNSAIVVSGGTLYAAWEDRRDGRGQIYISKSTNRGLTWSAPVSVNVSQYSAAAQQNPAVAVGPDGAVYVAWQENRSGGLNVNLYLARSNAGSLVFGPAVRVDDTGIQFSWQEFPSVAVNSRGIVVVVWKDDRDGSPSVYCARSTNRGDTFSANVRIDDGSGASVATGTPSLAVDTVGRFYVVWNDNRDLNSNIFLSRSTDDGATFQSSVRVDDTGTATSVQGNPSVAATGDGFVCVVWRDGRSGLLDLYSATSSNGGVSFNANVRIASASTARDVIAPKVAVDPWKNIYVVWEVIDSADSYIQFSYSMDLGLTFQKESSVSDAPAETYCTAPQLAVDAQGGVHVTWTDDRADEGDIRYAFASYSVSYARQPHVSQTISLLMSVSSSGDFRRL